jgi:prophage regulatory protein
MAVQMSNSYNRLIFKPELLERVGLSYSTVWQLMRKNRFPRSVAVTDGRVAWREDEIEEWIEALPRQRLKGDEDTSRCAMST